jgi:biotin carboxylase
MTHVLFVRAFRPLAPHLLSRGARISALVPAARIRPQDGRSFTRIVGMPAGAPMPEWVDIARVIHANDPIHAIAGVNEMDQEKAAAIATELHLPYNSLECVTAVRDKARMRERLANDPLTSVRFAVVSDGAAAREFMATCGGRIVLKPALGWASTGIRILSDPDGCDEAVDAVRESWPDSPVLAEEFLEGPEFSVEALSEDRCHWILAITRKYTDKDAVEIGHCLPALLPDGTVRRVEELVRRTLTALGVERGPTHTEIKLSPQGPRIIETHTRFGGDCIPELIHHASGVDPVAVAAEQIMGRSIVDTLRRGLPRERHAAIWYSSPQGVGTIRGITGLDAAKEMPDVVAAESCLEPGAVLSKHRSSFSRVAYVIAVASEEELAVASARAGADQIGAVLA